MYILGLHFGHDAGVCLLKNGEPVCVILEERITRIKHAIGLSVATLDALLEQTGVSATDIDYCAVTSTQKIDCISEDDKVLSLEWRRHADDSCPATMDAVLARYGLDLADGLTFKLADLLYNPRSHATEHEHFAPLFPRFRHTERSGLNNFGTLDRFIQPPAWQQKAGLDQLDRLVPESLFGDELRYGFHVPVTVKLKGHALPGSFVHHHAAHAASSFYSSGFGDASILTHDGFPGEGGYQSGLVFHGQGNALHPVVPHHLAIGTCYDHVAHLLGFGWMGGAGKLMGLSAFGEPRLFEQRFAGNNFDAQARFGRSQTAAWLAHCADYVRSQPDRQAFLGRAEHITRPVNADIAASTQALFSATRRHAADVIHRLMESLGRPTRRLCLSGGTALNCPSNTDILSGGRFEQVYIEPGCDDSGLAMGAALYAAHQLLDQPRADRQAHASPYRGRRFQQAHIERVLAEHAGQLSWHQPADAAQAAAGDIAADRVIGWFEGASEIGPRALGHRSILANPGPVENWARVNRLKQREQWRPFAPAVLEEDLQRHFSDSPDPSPYMLFNAMVKDPTLGAITHRDGSARVQTVSEDCGEFHRLLKHLREQNGSSVVLNTSFNGPGEPVVDSPEDALRFFLSSDLDRLYLDGLVVERTDR